MNINILSLTSSTIKIPVKLMVQKLTSSCVYTYICSFYIKNKI